MADTRIKLGISDLSRSDAGEPDVLLKNRYFEQDPTNLTDGSALVSRPVLIYYCNVGDGPIRAVYSQQGAFDGAFFTVSGDGVYKIMPDHNPFLDTPTLIGTLGTAVDSVSMAANDTYLFVADGSALYYYTENDYARQTLTVSGAISAAQVVRLGSIYYAWATDVSVGTPDGSVGNPWLVLIGSNIAESLVNLSAAIKDDGINGSQYSEALTSNPDITVDNITDTTVVVRAITRGTGGNAFVTTETMANGSFGAGTLLGGGDSSFTAIATPDGVGIVSVGVIAGFCICVVSQGEGMNGRFYWIWPESVTIDALDFATAERSPDTVWEVRVVGDAFWLPGEGTNEIWALSGDGNAPFIRQEGRLFDKGIWRGSIVQIKDSVMATGSDGVVYKINAQPEVVSPPHIVQKIREAINAKREA